MMNARLIEKVAIEMLRNFFREKPLLFFGTGMSCAVDNRFGMPALKDALISGITQYELTDIQNEEWHSVRSALQCGIDLESALDALTDPKLLKIVTDITGSFIAGVDREFALQIAQAKAEWPAIRLLKRLVDSLPEGDRILHALTPNYDMLFEYACDYERIPYVNGFAGGIERRTDWNAADCSLRSREKAGIGKKYQIVCKHKKHVRLYKVHGSLNYFYHRNGVIENSSWMWNPPDFAERVIITPGLSKYQTLQRYRQELLQAADAAINKATHFLFLGYGFGDNHLEEYIKRKLITQGCNGLIVTRDSNPRIEELLSRADNLWLVCKSDDASPEGTRIYNRQYSDWLRLPEIRLWDIFEFTARIIGG